MNLVDNNLWRFLDIFRSCQKKCCLGSFERTVESILTVRWGTVGMLRKFLRRAALTAGSLGLIAMRRPSQSVEKGSHDSVTAYSCSMGILWI